MLGAGLIFFMVDLLEIGTDGLRFWSCFPSADDPTVALQVWLLERLGFEYSSNFSVSSRDMLGKSNSDLYCGFSLSDSTVHRKENNFSLPPSLPPLSSYLSNSILKKIGERGDEATHIPWRTHNT